MATKNTENIPTAQNVYEGEELVKVKFPLTREEQGDVFVSVNERNWLIKRGEWVMVPKCVAEVMEHSDQAVQAGIEYIAKVGMGG